MRNCLEFDEKCCIFALVFIDSLMILWTGVTEVTVLFLKISRVPRTHRRVFILYLRYARKKLHFYCHFCHHCPIRVVKMPCTRCTKALYDRKRWLFRRYNRHLHQRDLADLTVVESISDSVSRHFYDRRTGLASREDAGPVFVVDKKWEILLSDSNILRTFAR